jgi:hypothetical protein
MSADNQESKKTNYLSLGLCLGLCFGVAFGIIMGVALGNMAFMSIGIGSGLSIGLAIGVALDERSKENKGWDMPKGGVSQVQDESRCWLGATCRGGEEVCNLGS